MKTMDNEMRQQRFDISGMDCASCVRTIETGVANLNDVDTVTLNFTTGVLQVEGAVTADQIIARVEELGYDVSDPDAPDSETAEPAVPANFSQYLLQRQETRLALLAAVLIIPGLIFDELLGGSVISSPLFSVMAVLAMVLAGWPIARSAWRALRINHEITINLLMTVAAVGAVAIGAYTEAGLVMVLFALGEALEGYTASRARNAISGLSSLAPSAATVLRPDGAEDVVPVDQLAIGDVIVVRPGERIPMDGRVVAGASSVNQAPITGESRLVDKETGDEVLASSVNGPGTLEIVVSQLAADNTISRLIRMVEEAQERRAPAQRFVDRFAHYYTPAVMIIALLVAIVPPLIWGQPFWSTAGAEGWLYRALALLVVACPCALVVSTPVTLISAITNGARHGVVFKGSAYLEELSRVQALALDKTGTITKGEPAVVDVVAAECTTSPEGFCEACDDVLAMAAAVERRSEHPLAQAVLDMAGARGVETRYPVGAQVTALAGRAVTGSVDGRQVMVGSHRHFDSTVPHDSFCADINLADARGYTTMLVADNNIYQGYISAADTLREGSHEAIAELDDMGLSPLVMLTGDNETTAERIAAEVGLMETEDGRVYAELLPEDKVAAVADLQAQYGHVAMVGDGINDTPAFATASVGVAMGRTAQALETADVVLLGDDLRQLPYAIRLARSAMRTVWFNVTFSIAIKLVFFVLILNGTGSMWLAVLADVGTSLLVTLNGMRLLRRPVLDLA